VETDCIRSSCSLLRLTRIKIALRTLSRHRQFPPAVCFLTGIFFPSRVWSADWKLEHPIQTRPLVEQTLFYVPKGFANFSRPGPERNETLRIKSFIIFSKMFLFEEKFLNVATFTVSIACTLHKLDMYCKRTAFLSFSSVRMWLINKLSIEIHQIWSWNYEIMSFTEYSYKFSVSEYSFTMFFRLLCPNCIGLSHIAAPLEPPNIHDWIFMR